MVPVGRLDSSKVDASVTFGPHYAEMTSRCRAATSGETR